MRVFGRRNNRWQIRTYRIIFFRASHLTIGRSIFTAHSSSPTPHALRRVSRACGWWRTRCRGDESGTDPSVKGEA
jgi:hypothetical protein